MNRDLFVDRHIGPEPKDLEKMLNVIGVKTVDELIDETVPKSIRLENELDLPEAMSEISYLTHIKELASRNKLFKSYIGLGYYGTVTPSVILRNVFENPGWYTSYTPYQAEISQGRLEALLNFQTMVIDLTAMDVANASLLDEATAAGEAMFMLFNSRSRDKVKLGANKLLVSNEVMPQTLALLETRSAPIGIELVVGDVKDIDLKEGFFGVILQYPGVNGGIINYAEFVTKAHENDVLVAVAADIMSLVLLTPPGEWGADIVFGTTQRFGVPMGFGGPHAAYFATKDQYKRNMPGRIIGISVDADGNRAFRMALQTREQHIKRERATSNICTAQALLAIMAGMYTVYHGAEGLKYIAGRIHQLANTIAVEVGKLGYTQLNKNYFDTVAIALPTGVAIASIEKLALAEGMNFRFGDSTVFISVDETTSIKDIETIVGIFAKAANKSVGSIAISNEKAICEKLVRSSAFLDEPIFKENHSETQLMRYLKRLENKDISLTHAMIPLGSCTMKLNAAATMLPLSWMEFNSIHPFVPVDQCEGYNAMHAEMDKLLSTITGFKKMSFQPNSGAAGEYTGLMVIRAYHASRGDVNRNVALIPSSAHGTNPASAAMAGMKVVVVKCDERGNIDVEDLRAKAIEYKESLSCLLVTYPSTHGVFEESIKEVISIIHQYGGQVYMDGANMNAQVGLTNPGTLGADVCHLNLHKTFGIPHGGGGPGMGPIGVAAHLAAFLPTHPVVKTGGDKGITAVAAAPYGSALVTLISYGYIRLLGKEGVKEATKYAIFNANYIKSRLEKYYSVLYTGNKGHVAHEMIIDMNPFKKTTNVEAIDVAKRLMDYGFHAPTVAFPVHGTLMIEPTESEPLNELDRFCDAMISIYKELEEIAEGKAALDNNVIKNAPHTLRMATAEAWEFPYSREKAVYPMANEVENKFWPSVRKIDDAFGDRNLCCKW